MHYFVHHASLLPHNDDIYIYIIKIMLYYLITLVTALEI